MGRIVDVRLVSPSHVSLAADVRSAAPTVQIHGIRNGYLEGELLGGVRLFLAGEQVLAASGSAFRLPADAFLRNHVRIVVPPGMQFVASKTGKKYYPVTSASGKRIVPKNRIYFRSAEEARAAGFAP